MAKFQPTLRPFSAFTAVVVVLTCGPYREAVNIEPPAGVALTCSVGDVVTCRGDLDWTSIVCTGGLPNPLDFCYGDVVWRSGEVVGGEDWVCWKVVGLLNPHGEEPSGIASEPPSPEGRSESIIAVPSERHEYSTRRSQC